MLTGRMKNARLWAPLLVAAAALTGWGCEGDNGFGPVKGSPPEILALSAPAEVRAGQKLDVAVRAAGEVALDSVVVKARGAFSADGQVVFQTTTFDQAVVISFDVPEEIAETTVVVTAYAYDRAGQVSTPVQDVVRVIDITPPTVSVSTDEGTVGLGEPLAIRVQASDNVGLARLGYRLLDSSGDTVTVELVNVTGSSADTTFFYLLPEDLEEGELGVEGIAEDLDGNRATDSETTALEVVDVIPPEVQFEVPAGGETFPTSLPLPVSVNASDNSGVASLEFQGFALRDNPFTGVPDRVARYKPLSVSFSPAASDTSFNAILVAEMDNTAEEAFIVVKATDARGNVRADTVTVTLDPDRAFAEIQQPAPGAVQPVGMPLTAAVHVMDNVGIARVEFSVVAERGDPALGNAETVARFEPVSATFSLGSQPSDTILTRILQPTADSTTEAAVLRIRVTDAEGNVSLVEQEILLQADDDAPSVAIQEPTDAWPAGAPLRITAAVSDQGGVASLTYEGFVLRGDPNLGTQTRVDIYVPKTVEFGAGVSPSDTTLTRVLDATGVTADGTELLHVVVNSTDRSGNVGSDTVLVALEQSAPVVRILDPADGLGYPIGDSLFVEAEVIDPTGISQVTLFGQALRGDPDLGTDEIVTRFQPKTVNLGGAATDTIITRYLVAAPDSLSEDAFVVVQAVDAQGNVGADTVTIRLGTPKIEILAPTDGATVQNDRSLGIRIRVTDPRGIQNARILVSGAVFDTIDYFPQDGAPTLVTAIVEDTAVALPDTAQGELFIEVSARNTLGIEGTPRGVALVISQEGSEDEILPSVAMQIQNPGRLELTDSIVVQLSGSDDAEGTGIVTAGYSVRGVSPSRSDTLFFSDSVTFSPPRTATVLREFAFTPFGADPTALPDTLVYEITGYMIDQEGNCAAVVSAGGTLESRACSTDTGTAPNGNPVTVVVAADLNGSHQIAHVVGGRTAILPQGGRIMDAAADTAGRTLFFSNLERNQVEVFRLQTERFASAIGVGSQPWGMTMNRGGDTLIVANSGGTNFSLIDINSEAEVDTDRFLTPDAVLFDVNVSDGDTGLNYEITEYPAGERLKFSDRPQFVAVDSFGNLLYTTRTTELGALGTARKAYFAPGMEQPEVKIMVEHTQFTLVEDAWALANIDNVRLDIVTEDDGEGNTVSQTEVVLVDHLPGFPNDVIVGSSSSSTGDAIVEAAGQLREAGSDVFVRSSTNWNATFAFSDTTFVAASGDGGWVLVGEGATDPVGKLIMYEAAPLDTLPLSTVREVWDDFTNRSDLVRGIGLNYDGSLGVARGGEVGFFDSDLRLQGIPSIFGDGGGTGAALHPLHANYKTNPNPAGEYRPDTHLAFVGGGDRTVEIVDTWRFLRVGQVAIRDNISGPLRAMLPFPEDNQGLTCSTVPVTDKRGIYIGDAVQLYTAGSFTAPIAPNGISDDRCVVVKLYGVTDAGGVVIIDVRKSDILRFHPNRLGA